MSGKNFITVCKWICGGWVVGYCTILMGQVAGRPMPGGPRVGRAANGALHHKLNPTPGTPLGAGRVLRNRMNRAYGKLPLSFEPNQGQANLQVNFLSRGEGYTLFLTGSEAVLALKKSSVVGDKKSVAQHPSFDPAAPRGPLPLSSFHRQDEPNEEIERPQDRKAGPALRDQSTVLRMRLVGANLTAKVIGLDEMQSKTNYFIGKDPKNWRTNVPNYARVKYEGVYPGVDLIYYSNQGGQLEYDFVVAPGADPNPITLDVGAGLVPPKDARDAGTVPNKSAPGLEPTKRAGQAPPLRLDGNGDLILPADGGDIRFQRPMVYQELSVDSSESTIQDNGQRTTYNGPLTANHQSSIAIRKFLDGRYILTANNQIGFEVAAYDHTKPLVIDPVLSYSTYLGGSNFDYAYGIAIDPAGNAYVTGQTDSVDFPNLGQVQSSGGGTCTDDLLSPFVCFDAFVAKLNPAGTALIYSTFLGGSNQDYGTGIAVDSSGNAYVTGYTLSTDFPTLNPFQAANAGGNCGTSLAPLPCYDSFVTKLDATGTALVYSTYLGGTGFDLASGISVDPSGAAYVVGSTSSTNFPVTGQPLQAAYGGGLYNAFVTKLNPAGSTIAYSTYLGGSREDHGAAIVIDSTGEAFITGYTNSSNFPTMNPLQGALASGTCGLGPCFDAFIAKLNATGSALIYSTFFGGNGGDYGYGIAADAAGDAYITGLTTSTNLPVTPGAYQPTGGGTNYDAYVMKMNPAGSALIYSTYLGGIGGEVANGIAVDLSGNAYVTGYNHGGAFPIASPLQSINNGFTDAFVAKMNAAGSALIFSTYLGGSGNDVGQGIAVDTSGNVFVVGGTFSADFPVTAGALKTTYGGGAYNAFVAKISDLILPVSSLSPTSIVFPGQGITTTSSPITVRLTNNGDATLVISSITATGDFAVTNDCGSSVLPGVGCILSITSTPTVFGPLFGTVTVTDNAWESPHVISLTGNGIPSSIVTLSPSTLTFGQQLVGATSPAQAVTLTNTGDATLNITSIAAGGSFSQTNNCSAVIIVGGGCVLHVTFSPTSRGTTVNQVTITDDGPGNPQALVLTGVGIGPAISLSSATLSFGNQLVNTTGAAQTVILTSSGEV
ncbi:MAG TPA: SBBP repeat-containing protein, partial [Terriglobia bacterium]|nr:SBBP repeat-containing protein [Terriglobia bacterium]